MCREHHQHSELVPDIYWILHGKYHPCPLVNCVVIDYFLPFFPTQTCLCCGCTLSSWLSSLCYVLPEVLPSFISRMSWELLHLFKILGIVILLTITIPSWSPCWFQQVNGVVWILPSSNPIALKLMVGRSFLDYWLLNHHSHIGRATPPIFRAHLSTNV